MKATIICFCLLLLAFAAVLTMDPKREEAAVNALSGSQDQSTGVEGKPTISATFIDSVLAASGSKAVGTGQALYQYGVTYGIDPVYALAFFLHESSFGTTGEARVTLSLGNIRCRPSAEIHVKIGHRGNEQKQ